MNDAMDAQHDQANNYDAEVVVQRNANQDEHAEANALNAMSEHDRDEIFAYDIEENRLMPSAYADKFVKDNVDPGIGPGIGMHTLCEKVAFLISKGSHATGDDKKNWYKAQDYLARYFESDNVGDSGSFIGYTNKWTNSADGSDHAQKWLRGYENLANCIAHYNESKK